MKRNLLIIIIAGGCSAALFALSGGCIPFGDKVVIGDSVKNATDQPVNVTIEYRSGKKQTITNMLPGGMDSENCHPGQPQLRYEHVVAHGIMGERIGEFNAEQFKGSNKDYGKNICLIITDKGIFLVPKKYLSGDVIRNQYQIINWHLGKPAKYANVQTADSAKVVGRRGGLRAMLKDGDANVRIVEVDGQIFKWPEGVAQAFVEPGQRVLGVRMEAGLSEGECLLKAEIQSHRQYRVEARYSSEGFNVGLYDETSEPHQLLAQKKVRAKSKRVEIPVTVYAQ